MISCDMFGAFSYSVAYIWLKMLREQCAVSTHEFEMLLFWLCVYMDFAAAVAGLALLGGDDDRYALGPTALAVCKAICMGSWSWSNGCLGDSYVKFSLVIHRFVADFSGRINI